MSLILFLSLLYTFLYKVGSPISSGGILLALAEMCISGKIGAKIKVPKDKTDLHRYLFGEDQSRYLIEIKEENKNKVYDILKKNSVYFEDIGITQRDNLDINKNLSIKINELEKLNTSWFKNYFGEN